MNSLTTSCGERGCANRERDGGQRQKRERGGAPPDTPGPEKAVRPQDRERRHSGQREGGARPEAQRLVAEDDPMAARVEGDRAEQIVGPVDPLGAPVDERLPSRIKTVGQHQIEQISSTLARGESVKISSFGTFSVRDNAQRIGRNPKTGEQVPILPRRVLVFRASHVLKNRMNRSLSGSGD